MTTSSRAAIRESLREEVERRRAPDIAQMFRKIQKAAHDGQNGSATYALDRLAFIQSIATLALHRLED